MSNIRVLASHHRSIQSLFRSSLIIICLSLLLTILAQAQDAYDHGTPAEAKAGESSDATYAPDKLETVNLTNGNLTISIPLVHIGGRGSAGLTLALTYNSKLWSARHWQDPGYTDPYGNYTPPFDHYGAVYNEKPAQINLNNLGGGWTILDAPTLRTNLVGIDDYVGAPHSGCSDGTVLQKYWVTRLSLVMPDGSEVDFRDSATEGTPYHAAVCAGGDLMNRGRIWHSTDGSAMTFLSDVNSDDSAS